MDSYPDNDPWNTPDVHKNHNHASEPPRINGASDVMSAGNANGGGESEGLFGTSPEAQAVPIRTTSNFTTSSTASIPAVGRSPAHPPPVVGSIGDGATGAWGYFDGTPSSFNTNNPSSLPNNTLENNPILNPFNPTENHHLPPPNHPALSGGGVVGGSQPSRTIGTSRPGGGSSGGVTGPEENILVTLMPEKEGMFLFQHHNYEVTSSRRGSKVIRRYSDFVWLLDCLHKRYPFRVLPLLPPKRVAGEYQSPA